MCSKKKKIKYIIFILKIFNGVNFRNVLRLFTFYCKLKMEEKKGKLLLIRVKLYKY